LQQFFVIMAEIRQTNDAKTIEMLSEPRNEIVITTKNDTQINETTTHLIEAIVNNSFTLAQTLHALLLIPSEEKMVTLIQASPNYILLKVSSSNNVEPNIKLRVRLTCDEHYYGVDCNSFCRSHDDAERFVFPSLRLYNFVHSSGHYKCSSTGHKVCLTGWSGEQCLTPICDKSCGENGVCIEPGICRWVIYFE
jgi:hypothetical protein